MTFINRVLCVPLRIIHQRQRVHFLAFLPVCVCVLTQNLPAQRARASPSANSAESRPAAASRPLQKIHRGLKVRGQGARSDRYGRSGATGPARVGWRVRRELE